MEPALKTDNVFILVKRSAANGWCVCLGTEAAGTSAPEPGPGPKDPGPGNIGLTEQ